MRACYRAPAPRPPSRGVALLPAATRQVGVDGRWLHACCARRPKCRRVAEELLPRCGSAPGCLRPRAGRQRQRRLCTCPPLGLFEAAPPGFFQPAAAVSKLRACLSLIAGPTGDVGREPTNSRCGHADVAPSSTPVRSMGAVGPITPRHRAKRLRSGGRSLLCPVAARWRGAGATPAQWTDRRPTSNGSRSHRRLDRLHRHSALDVIERSGALEVWVAADSSWKLLLEQAGEGRLRRGRMHWPIPRPALAASTRGSVLSDRLSRRLITIRCDLSNALVSRRPGPNVPPWEGTPRPGHK